MKKNIVIHCIGDSHVDFLSGLNSIQPEYPLSHPNRYSLFKTYRLGAVLAYTIANKESHGSVKLDAVLHEIPTESYVMLMLGEIDCRVHLIAQSEKRGKSLDTVVIDCVSRYCKKLLWLKKRGYRVVVWGAIPSTKFSVPDKDYPTVGTCKERNEVTRIFNFHLNAFAQKNNLPFISLFPDLVDSDGMTNMSYHIDSIHLSSRAAYLVAQKLAKTLTIPSAQIKETKNIDIVEYLRHYITRRLLHFVLVTFRVYPVAQRVSRILKK